MADRSPRGEQTERRRRHLSARAIAVYFGKYVSIGDTVVLRAYVDNNANPVRASYGDGTAVGTTVRFSLPDEPADDQVVWAFISADNADPSTVGDTVRLIADDAYTLTYAEDSARLFNSVFKEGFTLSSSIISDGAEIGVEEASDRFCCLLDGRYPACDPTRVGCEVFGSIVEITVRITDPDLRSGIASRPAKAHRAHGAQPPRTAVA